MSSKLKMHFFLGWRAYCGVELAGTEFKFAGTIGNVTCLSCLTSLRIDADEKIEALEEDVVNTKHALELAKMARADIQNRRYDVVKEA